MMDSTRLTLLRHGHTIWNGLGRYQGYAPVPLSARGLAQAEALADAFTGALVNDQAPVAIYSSDLLRCRQTAEPVAARLGLMPSYDACLREVDYGNWQGLTREEAATWDSDGYAAFCRAPERVSIPGGESRDLLASRVLATAEEILQRHAGEHVIVVTHGGPIREILRHFDLWPGGNPPGNASRTVLLASRSGSPALVCYADISHLPPELQPDLNGTTFLA